MEIEPIKKRSQEHWSKRPIRTKTAGFGSQYGEYTKEHFDDQASFRFNVYSPWLRDVARFDAYKGRSVLEVGCGMGTDAAQYAKAGAIVTGLDLTPRRVELARRRFQLYGLQGALVIGDAENLCFKDHSFDYAYSNGVLHHTPRTQSAIEEIYRVLKPNGEALIILYHKNSLHFYLQIFLFNGLKRLLNHLLTASLKEFSMQAVLSASTDGDTNPLTKVYSKTMGKEMMQMFKTVKAEVYHLNGVDFPLGFLFPKPVLQLLSRYVGWYLVLRALK